MTTIQDFAANALLADASYATGLVARLTSDALENALKIGNNARFKDAGALAKDIGARYVVLDQYTELAINGFSATVFQNKDTGEIHFVCRGTEPGIDLLHDVDLAINGVASQQIVALINYVVLR